VPGEPVLFGDDGSISLHVTSPPTPASRFRSSGRRRKMMLAEKAKLRVQAKETRKEFTSRTRHRAPLVRGRGTLASLVRGSQKLSRYADRAKSDTAARAFADVADRIQAKIAEVDALIAQLEASLVGVPRR
jgi:hypothetical protein